MLVIEFLNILTGLDQLLVHTLQRLDFAIQAGELLPQIMLFAQLFRPRGPSRPKEIDRDPQVSHGQDHQDNNKLLPHWTQWRHYMPSLAPEGSRGIQLAGV